MLHKHFPEYLLVISLKMQKTFLTSRRGLATIMFIVAGFFVSSCEMFPEPVEERKKISFGVSKSFLSIPVYIAKENGFFDEEDLDITFKEYGSGKQATNAMLNGEVDISTVANMPIVFNAFNGQDFCVFSTFTSSSFHLNLIGRKDRGVRTITDLKGKRVGVAGGTSSHLYLGVTLTHNHISFEDLEVIYLKINELPDALINGEVDVISIWSPYAQEILQALGNNAVTYQNSDIFQTNFSLAAKKELIQDRQPTLEKILRALDKAEAFIRSDKEKSLDTLTEIFDIEKEVLNTVLDKYNFGITLDQVLLVTLDDIARWARENQFVKQKKIPNFLDYICSDALDAVKPEAITIIR